MVFSRLAQRMVSRATPTATGTSSFTVKVTDANGQSATQATSITIAAGVSTTFAAPPTAVVNTAYSYTLTATGGTAPYTWSVNAGTLPDGLTLSAAGVLSGTPTTGSSTFSVNVIDANNGIATTSITLVVTAAVTFTFPAPPSGVVGTPYSVTLTAAGGTTPYTWSISAGSLPAGLTLNTSTGVVSGTPTAAGTASFTAKVTDAKGKNATFATSITILGGMLTIALTSSGATAAPGGTVTYTVTATNSGQITLTGATFTDALSDVLDDASYNNDASATAGSAVFSSPNLTWTGTLAVGRVRDDHVLGHGEQPRYREQDSGQHDHLGHDGQQLRERQHRRALLEHRRGLGPDHRHDREPGHRHPGPAGDLHDHRHQLGLGRLHRGGPG